MFGSKIPKSTLPHPTPKVKEVVFICAIFWKNYTTEASTRILNFTAIVRLISKSVQLKEINHEELMETLNESEKDRLEKYLIADNDLKEIESYNTFAYAFRLGALLMTEVFTGTRRADNDDNMF